MKSVNSYLALANRVKVKAVANNQLATARVASKVESELRSLDVRSYQAKQYLANVVPKLQQLNSMLG